MKKLNQQKKCKRFCSKCGFAKLVVVRPEDEGVCRCSPLQEPREKKRVIVLTHEQFENEKVGKAFASAGFEVK